MKNTLELVELFRALHGSDRKAAPHAGVSQATFSEWRSGEQWPSEERVETMARALGIDVAFALAVLRRDRAKSESVRAVWSKIAEGLAVIFLAVGATVTAPEVRAELRAEFNSNTHCTTRRRWTSALAA